MELIQESHLQTNQELDYIEKSVESFEDELRRVRGITSRQLIIIIIIISSSASFSLAIFFDTGEMCELKHNIARQISIDVIEQIEGCMYVFEKVKTLLDEEEKEEKKEQEKNGKADEKKDKE